MAITERQFKGAWSCMAKEDLLTLPDLTPDERRAAIDGRLDAHADDWLRKEIRQADGRAAAIAVLLRNEHYAAGAGHGISYTGSPDGLVVWLEEWEQYQIPGESHPRWRFIKSLRSSFIPWGEIADYVRDGATIAVQSALFA